MAAKDVIGGAHGQVDALSALPATFTYRQARSAGLSKHTLYRLRDTGQVGQLSRGVYRRVAAPAVDPVLAAVTAKSSRATLCLTTALVQHGLCDAIPQAPDVALPRGTRRPTTGGDVTWHTFDPTTFDVGRDQLTLAGGTVIGVYSAERSIVDAFRTRGTEGHELGIEALRRWVHRRGSHPAQLLAIAAHFPRTQAPLRAALHVLL